MLPLLLIPVLAVTGVLGRAVYKAVVSKQEFSSPEKSILQINLERLREELDASFGKKTAIIGQPGAGKSSLLKVMTEGKIKPLPVIGIETDATNWSHKDDCDLIGRCGEKNIFVDVPGYGTESHPSAVISRFFPFDRLDLIIFVFEGKLRETDHEVFTRAVQSGVKVFVCRSHSDSLNDSQRRAVVNDYRTRLMLDKSSSILFFSNRTREGVSDIYELI